MMSEIILNKHKILAELDSGAAINVMSRVLYRKMFSQAPLDKAKIQLVNYNGTRFRPIGKCVFEAQFQNQIKDLTFYIVESANAPLLGRDFMRKFGLYFDIRNVRCSGDVDRILKGFPEVFNDHLGTFKKGKAKLIIDKNACPKFYSPRPIPFAIKVKVEEEINRLVSGGILVPVDYSEWATPIVPIMKSDGSVRICGDFKLSINPVLVIERYVIPRIEDLFERVSGGIIFSKLDLAAAYQQIELEEDSQVYTTIYTHKGLFKYTRLPFGISACPLIFQKRIEGVLFDIEGVAIFQDDILVSGRNVAEHNRRLETVLKCLENAGLTVNKTKCEFFRDSVEYLGFVINKNGLQPSQKKMEAIVNMKPPNSVTKLKSFLGAVNYYRRFFPSASQTLGSLFELLKKDSKWEWTDECQLAFSQAKEILTSKTVLAHYDSNLPLQLETDASAGVKSCV